MNNYPNGVVVGTLGIGGLGERLKCVREMRHLTQAQLGEKISVAPTKISHWETGHNVPASGNLRKLCLTLDVSADYLLDSHTASKP